jgi:hypothetical protein
VVKNEGTIAEAVIRRLKIYGSPAPNTETVIIENKDGGQIWKFSMEDSEINALPNSPVPPPDHPAVPSQLSYKTRVSQLAEATATWYEKNFPLGPSPASNQYAPYWAEKMPVFHGDLGKQALILMQGLRDCPYPQVKSIYWREQHRVNLPQSVILEVQDLRALKDLLPDQDSQLPCVH